jgi:hypothetical protein
MNAKGLVILHRDQRRSTRDLRRFNIFGRIIDWFAIRRRCQFILTKGVVACRQCIGHSVDGRIQDTSVCIGHRRWCRRTGQYVAARQRPNRLHGHEMWAASLGTSVAASPTSATRKINAAMFARIRCSKSSGPSSCKSKSFRERSLNSYCERSSSSQMLLVEACTRFSANAVASLVRNLTTFISKLSFAACRSAACCASQARAVLSDVGQ